MTAHKHAALMLQYAQDARETETPWERWEYKHETESDALWTTPASNPLWLNCCEYRRKRLTMTIAGIEVPMPMTTAPGPYCDYWIVSFNSENNASRSKWSNDTIDNARLKAGMIHRSKQSASIHAEALIKATKDAMEAAR